MANFLGWSDEFCEEMNREMRRYEERKHGRRVKEIKVPVKLVKRKLSKYMKPNDSRNRHERRAAAAIAKKGKKK
jgi:hypothetical protein